jgi:vacuolar-type H+-ATPase subunit I/STV1
MKLHIRNQPDFFSGVLFIIVGIAFSLLSTRYKIGTAAEMGPAYFPLTLGGLLTALGLIITVRGVTRLDEEARLEPIFLRPIVLVLGSVALFGALLLPLGLVLASFVMLMGSALASHEFSWKYIIPTSVGLIATCYLIFVYGLSLPVPVWPRGF